MTKHYVTQSEKQNPGCCKHVHRDYSHCLICILMLEFNVSKCKEGRGNCVHYCRRYSGGLAPHPLCAHTGLERLPSGGGLTLTSCCHEDSVEHNHIICELENQKTCNDYEREEP
jgi:hypothetical protein